jgi:hypothetical protein
MVQNRKVVHCLERQPETVELKSLIRDAHHPVMRSRLGPDAVFSPFFTLFRPV